MNEKMERVIMKIGPPIILWGGLTNIALNTAAVLLRDKVKHEEIAIVEVGKPTQSKSMTTGKGTIGWE
ncbi:MAG: hypothetical protein V1909_04965 [Candidatus Micrarchaeota archaeon]